MCPYRLPRQRRRRRVPHRIRGLRLCSERRVRKRRERLRLKILRRRRSLVSDPFQKSPGVLPRLRRQVDLQNCCEQRHRKAASLAALKPRLRTRVKRQLPAERPGRFRPPLENKPGTFTQLFGTFGDAGTSPPAPPPMDRGTGDSSRGSAGSFTRMLSLEQQSTPAEPAYREERKPSAGSLDYESDSANGEAGGGEPRSIFSLAAAGAQPFQSTPPAGGAGITRLIQMLDDPSKTPAPRAEVAPVSPPGGAEPGVWTQTFASLATPNEPSAPTAKAPELGSAAGAARCNRVPSLARSQFPSRIERARGAYSAGSSRGVRTK